MIARIKTGADETVSANPVITQPVREHDAHQPAQQAVVMETVLSGDNQAPTIKWFIQSFLFSAGSEYCCQRRCQHD